jgi:hypothetical protein
MAGTTLLSQAQQSEQNQNDKELAAATTRYSPWTGMKAGPIRRVDTMGNIMKGLQTGAMASGMGFGGGAAPTGTGDPSALAAAASTSPLGIDYGDLSKFSGVAPETMATNLAPTTPMAGGLGLDYSKLASMAGPAAGGGAGNMFGMDMSKLAKYLKVSPWQAMLASNE